MSGQPGIRCPTWAARFAARSRSRSNSRTATMAMGMKMRLWLAAGMVAVNLTGAIAPALGQPAVANAPADVTTPDAKPTEVAVGDANATSVANPAAALARAEDLKNKAFQALRSGKFDVTSELLGEAEAASGDPKVATMQHWLTDYPHAHLDGRRRAPQAVRRIDRQRREAQRRRPRDVRLQLHRRCVPACRRQGCVPHCGKDQDRARPHGRARHAGGA